AAVESATHQYDASAERRGVTVELDLPSRPIRIRHDPPRIGQVVANLVGNAIKFTPRGGRVRVSVEPTPGGARIDVADTGVGIDPGELPHIFDRFYRGSRANEARGAWQERRPPNRRTSRRPPKDRAGSRAARPSSSPRWPQRHLRMRSALWRKLHRPTPRR